MAAKAIRDCQIMATNIKTGDKIPVRNGHKFSEKEAKEYLDMCLKLSKGNMTYEIVKECQLHYST